MKVWKSISLIVIILVLTRLTYKTFSRDDINEITPIKETIIQEEVIDTPPVSAPIEDNRWWTDKELDILAATIHYEAGSDDCTDRHQQLVGQVVINRVNHHGFPNTIYDVVTQTKPNIQYDTYKEILSAIETPEIIPQRCYDNALVVLNGEIDIPDNIIYQANFKQGSGIYEVLHTSYSTSYFCYE